MTTIIDKVKEVWPGASDEAAESLLWEASSFPFSDEESVMAQLKASYEKFGGDVRLAIDDAYAEIDRAMKEFNEKHKDDHGFV
jgi:hypothetical protein